MNNKIQKLIESGLSENTLKNLSEGQINRLYKRMVPEQVKGSVVMKKGTDPNQIKSYTDKGINVSMVEKEIEEDADLDMVNDPDATADGMGMFETEIGEGKKKKSKYNPWAICTSSVGREDKEKYERCVMDVKKSIKEGKNPYQSLVESALGKMIEKHISPKMTKKELVKNLSEQGIIRRPMTNMTIGFKDSMDKPTKKTYTSDMNEQGTKTAPPVVKPGTKEKPKTSDPFKNPKHQPKPKALDKPAKKMGTVEIPDYLTFDQLKINFKDQ